MPIFWLISSTAGSGRSAMSSPLSSLSIDTAASWPCATAQMMFFGPKAASPPKNTFGLVEAKVLRVDLGHAPLVEFDADVALDPGEGVLLADRHQHVVAGEMLVGLAGRDQLAAALGVVFRLHLLEGDAGELAVLVGEFLRHEIIMDRDALVLASSFSQGDAFISSKPERTTTSTFSPPSRRAERQQSMAVLPPPSTTTRLPILLVWPNDTEFSQSMPIWMFLAASLRPGMSRSRPRGAPEPTNTASQPSPAAPSGCRCVARRGIRRRDRGCSRIPRR